MDKHQFEHDGMNSAAEQRRAEIRAFDTHAPLGNQAPKTEEAQLLALFRMLDVRGQKTTLAMLAVAVKLHPKEA